MPMPSSIIREGIAMQTGRVVRLVVEDRYGVIETPDGHEAYFTSDCVEGEGFEGLRLGDQVNFAHEEAEQGMRATTVLRRGEGRRGPQEHPPQAPHRA